MASVHFSPSESWSTLNSFATLVYHHAQWCSPDSEPTETGKKSLDSGSHCLQFPITKLGCFQATFILQVFTISEPLKKNAKAPPLS